MRGLQNKVAVITASTDGIGFAIAKRLVEEGVKVVVSSRKQNNVDEAVAKLQSLKRGAVTGVVCHVGNEEDRHRLLKKANDEFGGIDIVVSNAAVNPYFGLFSETPEDAWRKIMDINLTASFLFCKEALPYLEARGGGSIVLVSSIGGYTPSNALGAYGISKTAMFQLGKMLAVELGPKNIRVNCIAPGVIETRFSQAIIQNKEYIDKLKSETPLRRYGQPEDCAGPVAFLVSDDASFITGETLVIAGGVHARL